MIAHLTADQLAPDPVGCTPHPAPRGYAVNDDGSNPATCGDLGRPVGNRIDPATGLCGYHAELERRRRRPLVGLPYQGSAFR